MESEKHSLEEEQEEWIGPLPTEDSSQPQKKKQKILPHEKLYLDNLPSTDCYEKSYMHRDNMNFVVVTKTDFVITCSNDGHVKFWKKLPDGIEFVKHFRAHLHPITSLSANVMGTLACTSSTDKNVKVFDVINFDMINMIKLDFTPSCTCWIYKGGDTIPCLAVGDAESPRILIYDGQGTNTPIHVIDKLHSKPVTVISFNAHFETVISVDKAGILEYWQGHRYNFKFPEKIVKYESKLDTSLYEFAKNKTEVTGLAITNDGLKFATISTDRKVRVFKFLTGKLIRVYDECLANFAEAQQLNRAVPNMEFSRRMNNEKDIEKTESLVYSNIIFDQSGHFILYSTMIGIKMVNIETNKCTKVIGKGDNLRPLNIALFQGKIRRSNAAVTFEQEASIDTASSSIGDPTLFCTAFKKQRFYLYSRRLPSDVQEVDRDVFNEQPSKEDILAVTENHTVQKIFDKAIIHTTLGDIFMKLFGKECPKTVENFCVHSKNGYYNGHIFHRVIKGFMVQTGDPTGSGSGGQSIWGHEFKDEFVHTLKHDRPYTVSMANAGPNTNGSQFFINVCNTPWLDNKHTIFGRVYKGMEVVQNISNVKTNPKTDKPYDEIKIISITLH
ncbi:unnamed protein product [Chironomus riparius]|uniref:peptidylprolyl isomerase n=1 Tax=Chironomus riparius TaxID=315576 RepID=A0A9N9WNB0_9DIPT|nr:unnamed protein product [Chironomus riparius]